MRLGMALLAQIIPIVVVCQSYEKHQLQFQGERQATILQKISGNETQDLMVLATVTEDGKEYFRAYQWVQVPVGFAEMSPFKINLPPNSAAFTLSNVVNHPQRGLLVLASDGVYGYENKSQSWVKVLHKQLFTSFAMPKPPSWMWTVDFDNNGLDDLAIPTRDSFCLYMQASPHQFGKSIPVKSKMVYDFVRTEESALTDPFRIGMSVRKEIPFPYPVDMNGDGKVDLVFSKDERVNIYYFDGERLNTDKILTIRELSTKAENNAVELAMVKFVSINDDKFIDMAITRWGGKLGITDSIQTDIFFVYGREDGFSSAGTNIHIDGLSVEPQFADVDGDGTPEFMVSKVSTAFFNLGKNALMGDMPIDYQIYQFDKAKGEFIRDAVWTGYKNVRVSEFEKKRASSVPLLRIDGDFDGDGKKDLMQISEFKEKQYRVECYRFKWAFLNGQRVIGFETVPFMTLEIPAYPDNVWVGDLNNDKKSDIMCEYSGSVVIFRSK